MFKGILLAVLTAALVYVLWPAPKVKLAGYESAREEMIRKLKLHEQHIINLDGDAEFQRYRVNYINRSRQVVDYIRNNNVQFYGMKSKEAIMYVKGFSEDIPRDGIYVNIDFLDVLQGSDALVQQAVLNELTHMAFWALDAPMGPIENLPRSSLPEYSDWYDFVILFSDNQAYIDKIILGKRS